MMMADLAFSLFNSNSIFIRIAGHSVLQIEVFWNKMSTGEQAVYRNLVLHSYVTPNGILKS